MLCAVVEDCHVFGCGVDADAGAAVGVESDVFGCDVVDADIADVGGLEGEGGAFYASEFKAAF